MHNSEIELRPIRLHWLASIDPYEDCCVHGGIYLRIGTHVLTDGNSEWTVSTAAFNFLRTISKDHVIGSSEDLIPCCGFNMWPDDTAIDGILIPNCNNGVDWQIRHEDESILHEFGPELTLLTKKRDWIVAVCRFADEVMDFFKTAWPKVIVDEYDRRGFELFLRLWQERRLAADKLINGSRR